MFDVNVFFSNFCDRDRYENLARHLQLISELQFTGKYIDVAGGSIPYYEVDPRLASFCDILRSAKWSEEDIEMVSFGIKVFSYQEIDNDIEALLLCTMLKDMFPEKTDLIDLIIVDLQSGMKEDHRESYKELFDLESDLMNIVLYYMS